MHDDAQMLSDVLGCLEDVVAKRMQPPQATRHLQSVAERHPQARMELVWEDQALDNSLHYDALIRTEGKGRTLSLSVCPDDALPWAVRGLQRWRDSEMLRVDNVTMMVEEAIGQLDVLWQKGALMQRLIDSCLIEAELRRQDVQVTPAEVQSTLDDMRRRRGLFTAAQLNNWLADSGMNLSTLQDMALKIARANKLRDVVVGAAAAEYFENHRAAFDRVKVAVLEVPNRDKAEEVAAHIRRHAAPLSEIAHQLFLMNDVDRTQFGFKCGARHDIEAEFELADLWPGTVHVVEAEQGCRLVEVLAIEPVKPSPVTLRAVKVKLFQDWLTLRRRSAKIEWFWGESQRTSRPAA